MNDRASVRTWTAQPPPGWEPVAAVCRAVFDDLPDVTARMIEVINAEVPEYGAPDPVFTADDLFRSTLRINAGFLHGVAENRVPTSDELAFQRYIGQQSAVIGCPLQALLAAYHIGYRELWPLLVERAVADGGEAPMLLLSGGSTIWERIHATTNALTEGYNTELARREAIELRATAQLIDAIVGDPASDECRSLAKDNGFHPDGTFRMLAVVGPVSSMDVARAIVSAIGRSGGRASSAQRARTAVIVCQDVTERALAAAVASCASDTPVGIGLEADGLSGARMSLLEAERALEVAVLRGRPCSFADDWLSAIALAHRSSVERLVRAGVEVARAKPHLAEAVAAFAGCGFSIAEGARRLGVSHNSFRYRLSRWRELTGWDPSTHDGLTRSLIALEFASP